MVLPSTAWSLNFNSVGRSSSGLPTLMPIFGNACVTSSNRSEANSIAFDGMQPTFRQVPPKVAHFSTTATFMPSCAARIAQT